MATKRKEPELMNSAEVAPLIGCSRDHVLRLWKAGRLKATADVGAGRRRHPRFSAEDVKAMQQQTTGGRS